MPLVESTLNMQTPASVAKGFTPSLVEESGEGHGLTHAYILVHTHACDPTHTSTRTHFYSLNLCPPAEKMKVGRYKA